MNRIVIYTTLFPFSQVSESFLSEEIRTVSNYGYSITIVPVKKESYKRSLPDSIELDQSICDSSLFKKVLCAIKMLNFLKWTTLGRIFQVIRKGEIGRALKYLYAASLVYDDLSKRTLEGIPTVFYGYWLFYIPIAFAAYKYKHPNTHHKFIVRGHGTDVYAENVGIYIPLRNFTFSNIDDVYPISDYGTGFLEKKYPQLKGKIHLSRLGVRDNYTQKGRSDCFRFISCSRVIPLKRVKLVFQSVQLYSRKHPEMEFEWVHIGDGDLFNELKNIVDANGNQVPNLKVILKGAMDNQDILDYYRNNNLNCFILLSTTEGIPVSIMEALSSGIPVIATSVGGVSEIVNDKTGQLLDVNFTQDEFNRAVDYIINNLDRLSSSAHAFYYENYNSESNYIEFYKSITNK